MIPKAHQGMVTAALRSVFAQETAQEIASRWDELATSLADRFPKAAALMNGAQEDVLAFRSFPQLHWRKIWSTNLLERVNEKIKRRTRVVGLFPNDVSIWKQEVHRRLTDDPIRHLTLFTIETGHAGRSFYTT
jgi:putative transposase